METVALTPQHFDFETAFDRLREQIREVNERAIRTETKLSALVGNGQPGKIQAIEAELAENKIWRARLGGIVFALTVLVSAGAEGIHLLFEYLKH